MENKNAKRKELLIYSSKSFEDASTYEKVHRHLRDINDVISEDDIRNVRTDIFSSDRNPAGEKERALLLAISKDGIDEEHMDVVYEEGKKITSSWNIVSE